MEDNFKSNLFSMSCSIGEQLILRSEKNTFGISWTTPLSGFGSHSLIVGKQEDLASGSSGIALFFLDLFQASKQEKYLNIAQEAIRWAINYTLSHLPPYPSYLNGNLGVVYALIKTHELTDHQSYLERALHLAGRALSQKSLCRLNYGEGISGGIIVLMRLYKLTKDDFILTLLHECLDRLQSEFQTSEIGIFWENPYHNPEQQLGFLTGGSGIAYTFLEAGNFFQNASYYYWADQSIQHELHLLKSAKSRQVLYKQSLYSYSDYANAFSIYSNQNEVNKAGEKINIGCNGSAGKALVLIKAGHILKNDHYLKDGTDLLNNCFDQNTDLQTDFSLKTGLAGLGDSLLQINGFNYDERLITIANSLGKKILNHNTNILAGNDLSLLSGMAGMGHFLLSLYNTAETESICFLQAKAKAENQNVTFRSDNFINEEKIVLLKKYPRTLSLLEKLLPQQLGILHRTDFKNSFTSEEAFEKLLDLFQVSVRKRFSDVFALELQRNKHKNQLNSPVNNHIKYLYNCFSLTSLAYIKDDYLVMDHSVLLHLSQWQWQEDNINNHSMNLGIPESQVFNMFRFISNDLIETTITPFTNAILECFATPNSYNSAFEVIKGALDISSTGDLIIAEEKFEGQINQLISNHILIRIINN